MVKKIESGSRIMEAIRATPLKDASLEEVKRAFIREGGPGELDNQQAKVVKSVGGKATLRDVADIAGEASTEGGHR